LEGQIELKKVEIDELNQELFKKDEKINKYKNHLIKSKYEKEQLEFKIKNEINNEKARIKELDDLEEKINEKIAIIDDKQDQIKYLRTLIDDYKLQIKNNTDNLELQLKKITKTYDNLISQKDAIIEKQDKTIEELLESKKQLSKNNQNTIKSLELQNGNYRELLKKYNPNFRG